MRKAAKSEVAPTAPQRREMGSNSRMASELSRTHAPQSPERRGDHLLDGLGPAFDVHRVIAVVNLMEGGERCSFDRQTVGMRSQTSLWVLSVCSFRANAAGLSISVVPSGWLRLFLENRDRSRSIDLR